MEQNPKQRFINALHGKPVDRIPCLSITQIGTVELMDMTGVAWPEAHSDPEKLAALPLQVTKSQGLKLYVTPTA